MSGLSKHRSLARYYGVQTRFARAGIVSLVSQIAFIPAAFMIGPTWLSLVGGVAAFIIGWLWPLPPQNERALAHIREEIGYVYDTALGMDEPDEFGFYEEVQREAAYREKAVLPPALPQWWIAFTLAALLVALVPTFVHITPRASLTISDTQTTAQMDDETAPENDPADAAPEAAVPDPTPPPAPDRPTGQPQREPEHGNAIDDFLADLEFAPDDSPISEEAGELGEALEQFEELADDTAYTEVETAPGDEPVEEAEDAPEGGVIEEAEDQNEMDDDSLAQATPGAEDDEGVGQAEDGEEVGLDDVAGLDAGADDDPGGAGDAPGTATNNAEHERLEGLPETPEHLAGITDGTMERSGSVRVQGTEEQAEVLTRPLSSYAESIEEELLGGSLPLPYQETVKKFFQ